MSCSKIMAARRARSQKPNALDPQMTGSFRFPSKRQHQDNVVNEGGPGDAHPGNNITARSAKRDSLDFGQVQSKNLSWNGW